MRNRTKWQPVVVNAVMDGRLQNWGDWRSREESPKRSHCASIEGRYRAPRAVGDDVDSVTRSPWRPLIDEADASMIDRVIKNPWFPESEYAFLYAHYVLRASRELVMRTIGQRRGDYLPYLARAVIMARNRVAVIEARRLAASDPAMRVEAAHGVGKGIDQCARLVHRAPSWSTDNQGANARSVVRNNKGLTTGGQGDYSASTISCGPSGLRSESDNGGKRAGMVDAANTV